MQQLLDSGAAYEDEGAVRFRVPDEGEIAFTDVVLGEITNPYSAIKDFVIQRSDGSPLYNLAVAVDDRDMGITHVVRGEDHLSNTPRQLMLVRALGAEPPVYAHLPLLHGPDGKKLSKRHGAASVQELREQGYLPEAVRNYIALLGWGYDESTTFMTTDELVERFALERVSKNPAVFDEQKLRWMNGRYMRELPVEELHRRLEEFYGREIPVEAVAISPGEDADARRLLAARRASWSSRQPSRREGVGEGGATATATCAPSREALAGVEPIRRGERRGGAARGRGRGWASSRRRSSSRCVWRSPARRCRRASSSRWRRWGARRRSRGSIKRSQKAEVAASETQPFVHPCRYPR